MGDRAVITTSKARDVKDSKEIGIYLHQFGGRDYVEAFLKYCKLRCFRTPEEQGYGWARLCQVIGNYIGGGLSIGIGRCCDLDCDNGDNGVYIIEGWEIVGRAYNRGFDRAYNPPGGWQTRDLKELIREIDRAQPVNEQFTTLEI